MNLKAKLCKLWVTMVDKQKIERLHWFCAVDKFVDS